MSGVPQRAGEGLALFRLLACAMILLSWLIRWLQWRFPFMFDGERCSKHVDAAIAEEMDLRRWAERWSINEPR